MKRSSSAASSSSTVPPAALMFHGLLKGHREGDTEGRYKVPIPTAEGIIMPMSYVHERYFGRPSCAKCGELMMAPYPRLKHLYQVVECSWCMTVPQLDVKGAGLRPNLRMHFALRY